MRKSEPAGGGFVQFVQLERDKVDSFEEYPFAIPAIKHLHRLDLNPGVTFIVGENGSGKSTLIEAIAVAAGFNPEGGSRSLRFSTRATEAGLGEYARAVRAPGRERRSFFLRAESFYNVATQIDQVDGG